MRALVVGPKAEVSFRAILRYSREAFGPVIRNRYRLLVEQAFIDLSVDPRRPGVRSLTGGLCLYPLRFSARRVPAPHRIARPRHLIAFRYDDGTVEIVELLYDGMDLPRRLG